MTNPYRHPISTPVPQLQGIATIASPNHQPKETPDSASTGQRLDWRKAAQLAGEHGIRYPSNVALVKFLVGALDIRTGDTEQVAWRCYHCDEVFTDDRCARLHFGRDESCTPACQIKAGAERGLIYALREAEYAAADAQLALATESTEAAKAYYALVARHATALRSAEEAGYERGLADGRAIAATAHESREAE